MDLGPNVRVCLVPFLAGYLVSFIAGTVLVYDWRIALLILAGLALLGMIQAWRNR